MDDEVQTSTGAVPAGLLKPTVDAPGAEKQETNPAERASSLQDHALHLGPSGAASQDSEPTAKSNDAEPLASLPSGGPVSESMGVGPSNASGEDNAQVGKDQSASGGGASDIPDAASGDRPEKEPEGAAAAAAGAAFQLETTPAEEAAPDDMKTGQAQASMEQAEIDVHLEEAVSEALPNEDLSLPVFEFPLMEKLLGLQKDLEVSGAGQLGSMRCSLVVAERYWGCVWA
jgi:hypothetical protein